MDILIVAAELSPFARDTEAGETIAALAKHLRHLGHDVTVLLPAYPTFAAQGLLLARRLSPVTLASGGEVYLLDGRLPSGVKLVLVDAPRFFDREGVYSASGEEFPDNAARFALLSQAVVGLLRQRKEQGSRFDVLHLHDWPAALVPALLAAEPELKVPTVLTIHDISQQGRVQEGQAASLGITSEVTEVMRVEGGELNLLKAGVELADAVTTVSAAYGRTWSEPSVGGPLSRWFSEERGVVGIGGGLDYALFNPASDPLLVSRFDAEDTSNKLFCKASWASQQGLELGAERPLLVAGVARRDPRGLELVEKAVPELLRQELSLVVIAQGELPEGAFELLRKWPDVSRLVTSADARTFHGALAAADIWLSARTIGASALEVQLAQRYGAVPVALSIPAVGDHLVDADAALATGTGFLFDEPEVQALSGAVGRALSAFGTPGWPGLRRRIMKQDLSWEGPVRRYLQVYRQVLASSATAA
jgi:starch synthase